MGKQLRNAAHTSRAWRIHEIAVGFRLENAWAIQIPGAGPNDFGPVLDTLFPLERTDDPFASAPAPLRILLAIRQYLGRLFRWDPSEPSDGARGLLRDHLPSDLRDTATNRSFAMMTSVYELDDECAFEFINNTVHGVMHMGWVPTAAGGYELHMAEITKPKGRLGRLYMTAIAPFRRTLAVPALLRQWERRFDAPQPTRR
ncbi:DUF2867 domain-containing protein [Nocardia cyriacigeorgica]|uniref:DUF2867 domain-containing protein n=1 Tax=Nocardia cyriacigeorgica TaxID=135487 RepID=A0A6P1D8Y5_9NOCA|nr:DUF2867 domain-containing protein [Nocardia cyriacigeorgica]NEW39887.1 DUF2867 domain-containing protein [Nocardia cyriacigeorgica]NEW45694.1 DUF2867 domain-containing protein [Nocardia cyriacigeorgica]NEW51372.1 DUF2867 domain-containing protein [Nocardia cyriacigeorgica]NEW55409.1 DUF2867 domain-containing protein [Nocardia cyriacigeorgica]